MLKNLVVSEIKRSIDLMDEFEDGDYEYLELKNWFWVKDLKDRKWAFDDNTGIYYVSLMISKNRNREKKLCSKEPTMTELRQMQHHGVVLDEDYKEGSMDQVISMACKKWEKDIFIELPMEICLRAQTSWNRMDYGCEWLGGGDWEEKTLYGETTDFFITGIILREPYKSTEQEAREILTELRNRRDENIDFISRAMVAFRHVEQPVKHSIYGPGVITEIHDNKMKVQFAKKSALFICPDSILQGFFSIPEHNEVIEDATEKWNKNIELEKLIKKFEYAEGDFMATYQAVRDYKYENN